MFRIVRIALLASVMSATALASGYALSSGSGCDCSPCACGETCACAGSQR